MAKRDGEEVNTQSIYPKRRTIASIALTTLIISLKEVRRSDLQMEKHDTRASQRCSKRIYGL
jgi:hypothetical protein